MAYLYDRGDRNSAIQIMENLIKIVVQAFRGEAETVHENLEKLSSNTSLKVDDPSLTFDYRRKATEEENEIVVTALPYAANVSENRIIVFSIDVNNPEYVLRGFIQAEASKEAKSWLFLNLPSGYCSDRQAATSGLATLSQKTLMFIPHP